MEEYVSFFYEFYCTDENTLGSAILFGPLKFKGNEHDVRDVAACPFFHRSNRGMNSMQIYNYYGHCGTNISLEINQNTNRYHLQNRSTKRNQTR